MKKQANGRRPPDITGGTLQCRATQLTVSAPDDILVSGELPIKEEADIVIARRTVREVATRSGFAPSDVTRLVTVASELARNVYCYAGLGRMHWRKLEGDSRVAIELKFIDQGPGIADIAGALSEGFSTSGGLGMGLPGAKRLTDEMEIESAVGKGTTVTLRKWRKNR